MNQCKRHFKDDPTAHATVMWFLSQLPGGVTCSNPKEFIISLSKEGSLLSESFFKGLTTARFIDCLRHQVVEGEREFFEPIEGIASELIKTGGWKTYPNLCLLLISMARKCLKRTDNKQSVRETSLYKIVEYVYHKYNDSINENHVSLENDVSLALESGIQLSHFQETEWQQEFAEFRTKHYEVLRKLRKRYYFSTDDPVMYSRHIRERYKWNNPALPNQEGLTDFEKKLEDFKEHILDSDFLNPLCLKLPILCRSSEAIYITNDFIQNLRRGSPNKQFSEKLARQFHILQWNIMYRDLIQESRSDGLLSFYPMTKQYDFEGIPSKDFLHESIEQTRSVESYFSPSHFIPTEWKIPSNPRKCKSSPVAKDTWENYYKSFEDMLSQTTRLHPSVHDDLIRSFANNRQSVVLIEDGEFSFFSLLWLLRRAKQQSMQLKDWLLGESKESKVRFCPRLNDENTGYTLYDFAEECGFIIRLSKPEGNCVFTTRWRSLILWLKRLNFELNEESDELNEENEDLWWDSRLPVKTLLDYDEKEKRFVKDLWEFLKGKELEGTLKELDVPSSDAPTSFETFVEKFGVLVESLNPLLEVGSLDDSEDKKELIDDFKDKTLLRCCRAGLIPLEHLFRAYFPCELHLLIQALNWEQAALGTSGSAPISIGFATIAGRVEPMPVRRNHDLQDGSENSKNPMTDFHQWLQPYHTLFSILGADMAGPVMQDVGAEKQKRYFAHQTAGLLGQVWNDLNRDKLDFKNNFALWLAKTQAVEIWGGIELDTTQPVDEDFPEWRDFDGKQIFDELVKFGMWGGMLRASKVPKDDDPDNLAWDLQNYSVKLPVNNPDLYDLNKLTCYLRQILSFKHPTAAPPDWITTKAFAICFYHGLWQAVYHALETFVLIDKKKVQRENPCLWVDWDEQSVSIYNRGKPVKNQNRIPTDREFFDLFQQKTDDFCQRNEIDEVFRIDGPEPADDMSDTWRLVIRKEKRDV